MRSFSLLPLRPGLALPTLIALGLALTLLGSPSGAAPPSYPLTCVGGGKMLVDFGGDDERTHVVVRFQPGTQAASAGGLQPGQCTWLDRGMSPGEPTALHATFNAYPQVVLSLSGPPGPNVSFRGLGDEAAANQFRAFWRALVQGQTFHVHAYASGMELVVTRFGP
jgi:hypothetical protein